MALDSGRQDIFPSSICEAGRSGAGESNQNPSKETREAGCILRPAVKVGVERSHERQALILEEPTATSRISVSHYLHDASLSPVPQSHTNPPSTMTVSLSRPERRPPGGRPTPALTRRQTQPSLSTSSTSISLSTSSSSNGAVSTPSRTTISASGTSSYTTATTTVSTASGLAARRPNNVAMIAGTLVAAIAIVASFIVVFLVGCRRQKQRRRYSLELPTPDPESTAPCPTGNSSSRLMPLTTRGGPTTPAGTAGGRIEAVGRPTLAGSSPIDTSTDDPPRYDHISHSPRPARELDATVK